VTRLASCRGIIPMPIVEAVFFTLMIIALSSAG
jgi:hypothetical protein